MSNAFSFMFSFYGLLLGLAVVEVATGFSRAYDDRRRRKLGVVAPLFGALLLVDLITFWMNAWAYRDLPNVSYPIALAVALIALLYYFAATQVFPKSGDDGPLDEHIMEHRRVIAFCMLLSNLMTQVPPAISAFRTPWPMSDVALWIALNLTYYTLLITAALARSKTVVAVAIAVAILFVTSATMIFA